MVTESVRRYIRAKNWCPLYAFNAKHQNNLTLDEIFITFDECYLFHSDVFRWAQTDEGRNFWFEKSLEFENAMG